LVIKTHEILCFLLFSLFYGRVVWEVCALWVQFGWIGFKMDDDDEIEG